MRKLALVFAMLSITAIGQPVDVDGWTKAKWGMTLADAKAAFGPDVSEADATGLLIKPVVIGSISTKGAIVKSKRGVIDSVLIDVTMDPRVPESLHDTSRSQRATMFDTLKTLLIEKYGTPKSEDRNPDASGDGVESTVVWTFPSTSITLLWSETAPRYGFGFISITYQAVDKKALDKL